MRRAFFFIVAVCLATPSFASIPRASALDVSSPSFDALTETRIRVSEALAPFERPAPSLLSRALHQSYEQASTTNASGLAGFLSVDPVIDLKRTLANPQAWNRYAYVRNNPLRFVDPTGLLDYEATLLGRTLKVHIDDTLTEKQQLALKARLDSAFKNINKNQKKLSNDEKTILGAIRSVNVDQSFKRDHVIENKGELRLASSNTNSVLFASREYLGSAIAHDSFHVGLSRIGANSRGAFAEWSSIWFQKQVGTKIGLKEYEINYLDGLMRNIEQLRQFWESDVD